MIKQKTLLHTNRPFNATASFAYNDFPENLSGFPKLFLKKSRATIRYTSYYANEFISALSNLDDLSSCHRVKHG
jgi:hypothetical protein